jgi:hypothetical protein
LRGPCFIAVILRVQIERRLNLAMTQDSRTVFGSTFALAGDRYEMAVAGREQGPDA